MTPVEAMSVGTPVIALRGGGLVETVREDVSGIFFDEPKVADLTRAMEKFESMAWSEKSLQAQAQKFGQARFENELQAIIQKAGHGK